MVDSVNVTVAEVVPATVAVPIVGALGAFAVIVAVVLELAAVLPPEFVAVTVHRRVFPTSADTSTYVLLVAPLIGVPLRFH